MSDIIIRAIQQLTAGSQSQALAAPSASANPVPAIRVVASQVNAAQIILTNPDTKRSVAIPAKLISSTSPISNGQSFALVAQSPNAKTLSLVSLSNTNTKPSAVSNLANLLTQANINNSIAAQQNTSIQLPLSDPQVDKTLASVLAANKPLLAQASPLNVAAKIVAIKGTELSLQLTLPQVNTKQRVNVSVPAEIAPQLLVGTSITAKLELSENKGKLVSISLPILKQTPDAAGAKPIQTIDFTATQQAKNPVPLATLAPAILPQTLKLPITPELLKALPNVLRDSIQGLQKQLNSALSSTLTVQANKSANSIKLGVSNSVIVADIPIKQLQGVINSSSALQSADDINPISTLKVKQETQTKPDAIVPNQNRAQTLARDDVIINADRVRTPANIPPSDIAAPVSQAVKLDTLLSQVVDNLRGERGLSRAQSNNIIQQLQQILPTLSKQALTHSAPLNSSIQNVLQSVNELQNLSPESVELLDKIKQTLPKVDANPANVDVANIRQLLGTGINPAPLNAISPSAQGGMLNGLMTLLQVTLASRLQQQSNQQASKIQQAIPDVVKTVVPNVKRPQSARLMHDFNQFDAKHLLTAEIAKILSSHAHNKARSAQTSIQGQDTLYYTLPNLFSAQQDDIELLVKRESRDQSSQYEIEQQQSQWKLSMKLAVGEDGEMLVKTTLIEHELKLQVYTSSEGLRIKVWEHMPLLQKRLKTLGITIVEKGCQLGKIPKVLSPENYQIFETSV